MTNSRRFQRACSLRAPKSPSLLDPSAPDLLEEVDLPWGSGDAASGRSSLMPRKEGARQKTVQSKANWGRRATSLRLQKARGEESMGMGEAAHSTGPGDGQLLIGEAYSKANSRVIKCKKVNRVLQRGWETFVTNVYSLTLSRPSSAPAALHPTWRRHNERKATPGLISQPGADSGSN